MTQTIPSSPINTRARSNFAARYVEHYLNRCCLECLVAEQEVRIEGTRVNTQSQPIPTVWPNFMEPYSYVSEMSREWFNDGHRRFLFYYCCCYAIGNEISSRVVKKLRVSARFHFTYFFFLSYSFSTLRVAILYHSKIKVSIMVRGVSLRSS